MINLVKYARFLYMGVLPAIVFSCAGKNVNNEVGNLNPEKPKKVKRLFVNEERTEYVSKKVLYAPSKMYFLESENKKHEKLEFYSLEPRSKKNKVKEVGYISKVPVELYREDMYLKPFHVFFKFDSYKIENSEKEKLKKVISLIKQKKIDEVVLEGYADDIGEEDYNVKLSYLRAKAVKSYLKERIKGKKVKFVLVPKGEIYSKNRNKSRRVTIKIEAVN